MMIRLPFLLIFALTLVLQSIGQVQIWQPGSYTLRENTTCSPLTVCDDGDSLTIDRCAQGQCVHTQILGLPNLPVLDLAVDQQGGLWGITENTLFHQQNQQVQEIWTYENSGLTALGRAWHSSVQEVIILDTAGNPWVMGQADGRMEHWNGSEWEHFSYLTHPIPQGLRLRAAVAPNNDLWVLSTESVTPFNDPQSLLHYDGQNWTVFALDSMPIPTSWHFEDIAVDDTGTVWLSAGDGTVRYDGNWTSDYTGVAWGSFWRFGFHLQNGQAWQFYSNGQLFQFDGTAWQLFHTFPTGVHPRTLAADSQGNLYVGTNGHGLWRKGGGGWTSFTMSNSNLPYNDIVDLVPDTTNNLIYGLTAAEEVFQVDGTTVSTLNRYSGGPPAGLPEPKVAPDGSVWLTSTMYPDPQLLTRFDGLNWQSFAVPGEIVTEIDFSSNGTVWIARADSLTPLMSYDGTQFSSFTLGGDPLLVHNGVIELVVDSLDRVWLNARQGSGNVIWRLDGTNWQSYSMAGGNLPAGRLGALMEGQYGEMWLYSYSTQELFHFQNGAWTVARTNVPDPNNNQMVLDDLGGVWILNRHSVWHYNGQTDTLYETQTGAAPRGIYEGYLTKDLNGTIQIGGPLNEIYSFTGQGWDTLSLSLYGLSTDSAIKVAYDPQGLGMYLSMHNTFAFVNNSSVMTVWPGDANHDGIANYLDLLNIGLAYDSVGPVRSPASLNWMGQPASPWNYQFADGLNWAHADVDGNGIIEAADTLAILLNYNQIHNKTGRLQSNHGPPLRLIPDRDSLLVGDTLYLDIELGVDTLPADTIYGIGFSIAYDPFLVEPGSITVDFDNCWVGTKGLDLLTLTHDDSFFGRLDIALTRTDHLNTSGFGHLGKVRIIMIDDISGKNFIHDTLPFTIEAVRMIRHDETELPVDASGTKVTIWQEGTENRSRPDPNLWTLGPNPTQGKLNIRYQGSLWKPSHVRIFDLAGREILDQEMPLPSLFVKLHNQPPGIYLLEITAPKGVFYQKIKIIP